MSDRRRRCGLVFAAALFAASPAPTAASTEIVSGSKIVHDLRNGGPVVLVRVNVKGPLVLGRADVVRSVFKCRECTFLDGVLATDVSFERVIDLSGSTFEGDVDFRAATFRAPALFRAAVPEEPGETKAKEATLVGRADFSLAVFDDLASFAGAEFRSAAVFRDARFADSTFAGAEFSGSAAFERSAFRGPATFNGVTFKGPVSFQEATFQQRTDFSLARFMQGGVFTAAQFGSGASFLAADFVSTSGESEAAAFDEAASSRNLDFTFTSFQSKARPPQVVAIFDDLVIGGSLVFREAMFPKRDRLHMKRAQVTDLVMDVERALQIENEGDKRKALGMIEASAKARNELGLANDAHYELRLLRSEDFGDMRRFLDHLFYRDVAGYLVRPTHPVGLLLILVLFATGVRFVARIASGHVEHDALWRRVPRWVWGQFLNLLNCLLDTFARVSPRWKNDGPALGLLQRLELIGYRVLVVVALVALANSNPTLRDMVDALA